MLDKYIIIGHTKKAHGAEGEIKFFIEEKYLADFLAHPFVFLNVQNKPLPFFIENIRAGRDLIVKLEEVDTPQAAKEITSSPIFLREKDITEMPEKEADEDGEFTYEKLIGFELLDEKEASIGSILAIQENKFQDLLIVKHDGREIMVPLHDDLIEWVDSGAKKISLQLPEGLLDL